MAGCKVLRKKGKVGKNSFLLLAKRFYLYSRINVGITVASNATTSTLFVRWPSVELNTTDRRGELFAYSSRLADRALFKFYFTFRWTPSVTLIEDTLACVLNGQEAEGIGRASLFNKFYTVAFLLPLAFSFCFYPYSVVCCFSTLFLCIDIL